MWFLFSCLVYTLYLQFGSKFIYLAHTLIFFSFFTKVHIFQFPFTGNLNKNNEKQLCHSLNIRFSLEISSTKSLSSLLLHPASLKFSQYWSNATGLCLSIIQLARITSQWLPSSPLKPPRPYLLLFYFAV